MNETEKTSIQTDATATAKTKPLEIKLALRIGRRNIWQLLKGVRRAIKRSAICAGRAEKWAQQGRPGIFVAEQTRGAVIYGVLAEAFQAELKKRGVA